MQDGYEPDMPASRTEGKRLLSIVERIERLTEEIAELQADKREIMAEARSDGFDTKALAVLIKERSEDPSKAEQLDMMVELYRRAIAAAEKPDEFNNTDVTISAKGGKSVKLKAGDIRKIAEAVG